MIIENRILELPDKKITIFSDLYLLSTKSIILPPKESDSGLWEVINGDEKIMEIWFRGDVTFDDVSLLVSGMELAFANGHQVGLQEMKRTTSYALRSLMGTADLSYLMQAADDEHEESKGKSADG